MSDIRTTAPRRSKEVPSAREADWLYLKLYAGTAAADRAIVGVIREFAKLTMQSGSVTNWFFIRYGDPDWHLRVRFRGHATMLMSQTLPEFMASLEELQREGAIWKVQVDTYAPEYTRYGGPVGLAIAEDLFGIDSDFVVTALSLLPREGLEEHRWRLALASMNHLMTDFGLSIREKFLFCSHVRESFRKEFDPSGRLSAALSGKYRNIRSEVDLVLFDESMTAHLPGSIRDETLRRSARTERLFKDIRYLSGGGGLFCSPEAFLGSILHMNVNRIMRHSARKQEFVLYDYLSRAYASRLARERRAQVPS